MLFRNVHLIDIDALLEPPLCLRDLDIVATHLALAHAPILGKGPILQAIAALPLHPVMRVLILVPELHRNFVLREGEQLLAEGVVLFLVPFPGQEFDDVGSPGQEFVAVAPDAVWGVGLRNDLRVS